jgi:hypothetical protein
MQAKEQNQLQLNPETAAGYTTAFTVEHITINTDNKDFERKNR